MRLISRMLLLTLCVAAGVWTQTRAQLSQQSQACVGCHEATSPGLIGQWRESGHQKSHVGCFECHKADKGDPDAFDHNGFLIATIVSPKDCSQCHNKEYQEFEASHHSEAAKILGSLDNVLAEVVEGNMKHDSPAAVNGCWQCHGGEVKVLANGKLDPATWPNTGVGRLNPDGSKGVVPPATCAITSAGRRRACQRIAGAATSAPTIRRWRSTPNRSMGLRSRPTAADSSP